MIRTAAYYDALYREFRLILELKPSHLGVTRPPAELDR
jgi:hypothetical protein